MVVGGVASVGGVRKRVEVEVHNDDDDRKQEEDHHQEEEEEEEPTQPVKSRKPTFLAAQTSTYIKDLHGFLVFMKTYYTFLPLHQSADKK